MNPVIPGSIERVRAVFEAVKAEVRKAIVGQDEVLDQVGMAVLAGGHVLLEGLPGTAKTLMARAFACALRCRFVRIQFTPDLMPADITGTSVFDPGKREFEFRRGPVFTDLLLADEINRAPAKTQAALLDAMQERRVTSDGQPLPLSPVFTTLATQNPVECEGTYPLPEAQLDRFMFKIVVRYPSAGEERELLGRYRDGQALHEVDTLGIAPKTTAEEILNLRLALRGVTVEDAILAYIADIVRQTREWATITLGASPRAGVMLLEAARACAAIRGRAFVIPDDVKALAAPVLRHRLMIKPESEIEGVRPDDVIRDLLATVKVPK